MNGSGCCFTCGYALERSKEAKVYDRSENST
jgi:hypothetical protein